MRPRLLPGAAVGPAILSILWLSGCTPGRAAVAGPMPAPTSRADVYRAGTRLDGPTRIDFEWQLNEQGSRVSGQGVARIEPPYRARLDLFHNLETAVTAALVGDDLRLPPGAPEDVLPPVELMWATLGVFRPFAGTRLIGGDQLVDEGERLRYESPGGRELHFDLRDGRVEAAEVLEGGSVLEWVRLETDPEGRYPLRATYRNLVDYRELTITRTEVSDALPFDPSIWTLGR